MNRIVVIGSTGFIGKSFIEKALSKSEYLGLSSNDIDLCSQQAPKKLEAILKEDDHVLFLSALKKDYGNNHNLYLKNTVMAKNLADALKVKRPKSLIFLSSASIYGEEVNNLNITEDTPPNPTSYYGLSKYTSENIIKLERTNQQEYPIITLRPPTVYGAQDQGESYGPAGFIKKAIRKEKIVTWGDATELREFIYINDLVKIMYESLFINQDTTLNVASGKSYSFKDILNFLEKKTPLSLDNKERSKSKVDNVFNNEKLKKCFSDFSFTTLDDGLEHMFTHLKSNL